ncbi:hypothetical protein OHB53_04085 [Streptomyces sp. NBC_00056]|uniref:hypothetical protein n=1 Tax=unclassified Streptomyces TaxID=2593676 RepID=UPI002255BE46|nr:hypothetical protein [Streptomyces sp. NBC_00063]MCX5442206.1 hypothetical protein [Streptomyces sp. NBC_00063]
MAEVPMSARAAATAGLDTLPRQARAGRFTVVAFGSARDARVAGLVRDRLDRERGSGLVLYEHALGGRVAVTPWDAHTPRTNPRGAR